MLAYDHKDQVADPDDVPAKNKAQDAGYDFAFADSGDYAADPGSHGDNRQDYADDITESEIIALCHD